MRRRVLVRGRVHGVGYRVSCARRAEVAGLAGWVRNQPDGSVEAELEGPSAVVEELVTWCRKGPPAARVATVDVSELPPSGLTDFTIR